MLGASTQKSVAEKQREQAVSKPKHRISCYVSGVQFLPPLQSAKLIKRYKRFLADVMLESGEMVTAHCANPGRMTTCLFPGRKVWISESRDPKRKLRYTWELAETPRGLVDVFPLRANRLFSEAFEQKKLQCFSEYSSIQAECTLSTGARIDFRLSDASERMVYVEVKHVTMSADFEPGTYRFPDAPSARALKHIGELIELKRQGHDAVLFFHAGAADAECVAPAWDVDPSYCTVLQAAVKGGLRVMAFRSEPSVGETAITREIPFLLQR